MVLNAQELQRALASAIEHLQAGQEEQAESEISRVLQSDPNNRLAQSLLRQIKDDPLVALGRESFAYRVQPGESLSRLAQRHLNDLHLFYILARYNQIKVPRTLAGGQLIRLPGRAPAVAGPSGAVAPGGAMGPVAPAAPSSTGSAGPNTTAAGGSSPGAAAAGGTPAPAPAATEAAAAARTARVRAEAIARHSRAARAAFAKQDLDAAIRAWDAVLEIEPDNRTALLEKQKVQGLREKLGKVK